MAIAPVFLEGYAARQGRRLAGASLALQQGVLTVIHAACHGGAKHRLLFNSQVSRPAVLARITRKFEEHLDEVPLDITQTCLLPDAAGAALMLARARSLALALNEWCDGPFSQEGCEEVVRKAGRKTDYPLLVGGPSGGMRIHAMDGKIHHARLTLQELRTPINLHFYGRGDRKAPSAKQEADEFMWADGADERMRQTPSLERFAQASRYFAGRTERGRWARKALEGKESAGVWVGNRCVFELGTGIGAESEIKTPEGRPKTPRTIVTYATNLGARVLPADA